MSDSKCLTIIDLPAMNIQAHCHEGQDGTSYFKEKGIPNEEAKTIPMLTSYEFAKGQVYAENLGMKVIKK